MIKKFNTFILEARSPLEIVKDIDIKKVDGELYKLISSDINAVKYLINTGLNVNLENGLPLISAAKSENKPLVDLLITNGADLLVNNSIIFKILSKNGMSEMLVYLINKLLSDNSKIARNKNFYSELIKSASESENISGIKKQEIINIIKTQEQKNCI
jgi:hypothetical protein